MCAPFSPYPTQSIGLKDWLWVAAMAVGLLALTFSFVMGLAWLVARASEPSPETKARWEASEKVNREELLVRVCVDGSTIYTYEGRLHVRSRNGWSRGWAATGSKPEDICPPILNP